jgi:hypothetical protein
MKKLLNTRIEEEALNYITHIAETCSIPKSTATELIAQVVSIYFTDEQLILESQMMKKADGRTTRWQKRAEEVIVY